MNSLYQLTAKLQGRKNYVYTTGHRAEAFASSYQPIDGFVVRLGKEETRMDTFCGKPVITLEEAASLSVNVLIVHTFWYALYEEVCSKIAPERIYFHNENYKESEESCMICGSNTLRGKAAFVPFLQERMFLNNPPATSLVFCPKCGSCYSSYRPTDEEISRLYAGYRNAEYVRQRQKYEDYYTEEFNKSLSGGNSCPERKNKLARFLEDSIDFGAMSQVLDFGGDKGQFIPDEFRQSECYVYDISGTEVLEGIHLIKKPETLSDYKWDFIMCCHVMEHLPDVQAYFGQLVSLMNDNTYLYVEVPYERPGNMDFVYVHEHINMFGRKAFHELAQRNGLKVIKSAVGCNIRFLMKRCK